LLIVLHAFHSIGKVLRFPSFSSIINEVYRYVGKLGFSIACLKIHIAPPFLLFFLVAIGHITLSLLATVLGCCTGILLSCLQGLIAKLHLSLYLMLLLLKKHRQMSIRSFINGY